MTNEDCVFAAFGGPVREGRIPICLLSMAARWRLQVGGAQEFVVVVWCGLVCKVLAWPRAESPNWHLDGVARDLHTICTQTTRTATRNEPDKTLGRGGGRGLELGRSSIEFRPYLHAQYSHPSGWLASSRNVPPRCSAQDG